MTAARPRSPPEECRRQRAPRATTCTRPTWSAGSEMTSASARRSSRSRAQALVALLQLRRRCGSEALDIAMVLMSQAIDFRRKAVLRFHRMGSRRPRGRDELTIRRWRERAVGATGGRGCFAGSTLHLTHTAATPDSPPRSWGLARFYGQLRQPARTAALPGQAGRLSARRVDWNGSIARFCRIVGPVPGHRC